MSKEQSRRRGIELARVRRAARKSRIGVPLTEREQRELAREVERVRRERRYQLASLKLDRELQESVDQLEAGVTPAVEDQDRAAALVVGNGAWFDAGTLQRLSDAEQGKLNAALRGGRDGAE